MGNKNTCENYDLFSNNSIFLHSALAHAGSCTS